MRSDKRAPDELRSVNIITGFIRQATGSALIELGNTRVICTATVEEQVPQFLRDSGRGWVTAEYSMLPGSSQQRIQREAARGRIGGRTHEIQRLIGRSLRSVIDFERLGPRTVWLDCDVIEADGGTRTASITGAYVALALATQKLKSAGTIANDPLLGSVAAVSVGIVDGEALLDLCYTEDSKAEVDMNFVMTGSGQYVEVQGTAESKPFSKGQLDTLAGLAQKGVEELTRLQAAAIKIPA
ncbi:MAG: ribonuclease PH [Deltaproteobacteria bacterium]|nr:ribonuclease PH [Deltaproteobacteria bacterium]